LYLFFVLSEFLLLSLTEVAKPHKVSKINQLESKNNEISPTNLIEQFSRNDIKK
jgi:hypothetical protein